MKTEIGYNDKSQETNDRKALNDTLNWYRKPKAFKTIVKYVKGGCSKEQLRFAMGFSGVEGYPVEAMWRRYHIKNEK